MSLFEYVNLTFDQFISMNVGIRSMPLIEQRKRYSNYLIEAATFQESMMMNSVAYGQGAAQSTDAVAPSPSPLPPSVTPSISVSVTPSITATPSITITPSVTATPSVTITPSISESPLATVTPSVTVTPTISETPSVTPSVSISVTPSITITPTPTATISVTPSITPSITVTPTPSPSAAVPIVANPYFHYDIGNTLSYGGTGTTLFDLSGNGRDATIYGSPAYTASAGSLSGYFTFDGVNDYVATPNLFHFGSGSGGPVNVLHTIELWIRPSAIDDNFFSDASTTTPNTGYTATGGQIFSSGPFQTIISCLLSPGSPTTIVRSVGGAGSYTNTWRHVVRTYATSSLSGSLTSYINGVAGASTALPSFWQAPYITAGNNWYMLFGAQETQKVFSTPAGWFAGRYGVMRMYNRVLTLAEIQQNFNAERSKYGV